MFCILSSQPSRLFEMGTDIKVLPLLMLIKIQMNTIMLLFHMLFLDMDWFVPPRRKHIKIILDKRGVSQVE